MSGGPEDNPHDDEPIDREEYEKAMTPKPSDSLSERARELAQDWCYKVYAWRGRSPQFMQAQVSRLSELIAPKLADAFNLGAAMAYADAAQVAKAFSPSMPESEWNWNAIFGLRIGEAIERRTPPDASVAIERRVSEARLEQVKTALAVAHGYSENNEDAGLAALEYLMLRKCELQTALQAEAAEKEEKK